ncbi:MAG: hypothetical protein JXD19_01985 [Deltaproteobacteria bacterium]|nr:hypothetical protein [Deltaproteobacteria bacterium]
MITYRGYVSCDFCGELHSLSPSVLIKGGPAKRISIAELYSGRDVPTDVAVLQNQQIFCPATGKTFCETDRSKIYLFPIYPLKGGG